MAANKCDLYEKEQVSEEEGRDFAKEINAIFQYTSAKEDIGINKLFESIAKEYFERNEEKIKERAKEIAKERAKERISSRLNEFLNYQFIRNILIII